VTCKVLGWLSFRQGLEVDECKVSTMSRCCLCTNNSVGGYQERAGPAWQGGGIDSVRRVASRRGLVPENFALQKLSTGGGLREC
jgi:hypothetical protein